MLNEKQIASCTVCGYEYDPIIGDPENGIPPGTLWKDVHDDWLCPDCQMPKADFELVSPNSAPVDS
ncbi:rubredoxin [Pseudomonas fluorescens]|jgi:rubredoxin|uniref:rubredoxin n=1 Tax=Pseudomonas fluorescens TaxID=294 RepID=UPI002ACA9441|nr:rubredoxin [Pseudomonas fluorescens]MDZ5433719.1 rubredoxin [Pseudomonas fluorescens]